MKIKLFYNEEYVEGKNDYSYREVTVNSWKDFWNLWNDSSEFIMCDNTFDGRKIYIKKDRVIEVIEGRK